MKSDDNKVSSSQSVSFDIVGIDIDRFAQLANLTLTEQEKRSYAEQLQRIIQYCVSKLSFPVQDIEPTYNISGLFNVMRGDDIGECLSQREALENAKDKKEGFILLKGNSDNE